MRACVTECGQARGRQGTDMGHCTPIALAHSVCQQSQGRAGQGKLLSARVGASGRLGSVPAPHSLVPHSPVPPLPGAPLSSAPLPGAPLPGAPLSGCARSSAIALTAPMMHPMPAMPPVSLGVLHVNPYAGVHAGSLMLRGGPQGGLRPFWRRVGEGRGQRPRRLQTARRQAAVRTMIKVFTFGGGSWLFRDNSFLRLLRILFGCSILAHSMILHTGICVVWQGLPPL